MTSHQIEVTMRDGLLCDIDCINDTADELLLEIIGPIPQLPDDEEGEERQYPGVVGKDPWCILSSYGPSSCTEKELQELIGPDEEGGLIWTAQLVPEGSVIKPRRGMPFPVTTEDFLSSVRRIGIPSVTVQAEAGYEDLWDRHSRHESTLPTENARWVFHGVLNGWPGLTLMEVRSVRVQERETILKKMLSTSSSKGKKIWHCVTDGNDREIDLVDAINGYKGSKHSVITVELRSPSWSSQGWSKDSPGFVMWTEGQNVEDRKSSTPFQLNMNYGIDIIKNTIEKRDPACTMVHMINHRYASPNKPESAKDRLLYHSIVLLEWDHQKYCSVVEIGFLNGLGGNKGKSNWVQDKDATPYSAIYAAFPPEMILPWKTTLSEIRVTNVPYRNKDDLINNYMNQYEGHKGRFVDTNCSFSHEVRLTFNLRSHIATYLVNYILRDKTYSEMKRNCQTFAADLCGFLAGKKDISPYHPVNQIQYHNSTHTFLYESSKYSKKKKSTYF